MKTFRQWTEDVGQMPDGAASISGGLNVAPPAAAGVPSRGRPSGPSTEPEPSKDEWDFYDTKVTPAIQKYMNWLIQELQDNNLTLYKRGFIIQEIYKALGFKDIQQLVRVIQNIKRAEAKRMNSSQEPSHDVMDI